MTIDQPAITPFPKRHTGSDLNDHDTGEPSRPSSPRQFVSRSQTFNSFRSSVYGSDPGNFKPLSQGHYETFNSLDTTGSCDPKWTHQNVLCLDGGGVRGYSTLIILNELMSKIEAIERSHQEPANSSFHPKSPVSFGFEDAEVTPEQQRKRWTIGKAKDKQKQTLPKVKPEESFYPCHYFDYIFGTSTGGLIAILLGRLRLTVKEALVLYENLAGEVFGTPRIGSMRSLLFWPRGKYDHSKLEHAIKTVVNAHTSEITNHAYQQAAGNVFNPDPTFNSEPLMCRTVCISYLSRGRTKPKPFLFRSYEHAASGIDWVRNPGAAHAIPIWKVGRATSAAPSYFEPMQIDGFDFLDGGLGCNNPSLEAYKEVSIIHNQASNALGMLLSVGTGESEFDLCGRSGWTNFLRTLRAFPKVATNAEPVHETMMQLQSSQRIPYVRFNVPEDLGELKMDTWRTKNSRPKHSPDQQNTLHGRAGGLSDISNLTSDSSSASSSASASPSPRKSSRPVEFSPASPLSTSSYIRQLTKSYISRPDIQFKLQKTAEQLVSSRRDRAKTARWEFFASGRRYRCVEEHCPSGHRYKETKEALRKHIVRRHIKLDPKGGMHEEQKRKLKWMLEKGRM